MIDINKYKVACVNFLGEKYNIGVDFTMLNWISIDWKPMTGALINILHKTDSH